MMSTRFASLIALAALAGCFTLQPATAGQRQPGQQLAFDITDEGRVALGGSIGPEIDQIEGRLIDASNGEYVVAVSAVRFLRGGEQVWTGERVRIQRQHVNSVYARRFSRGRSLALGAAAAGGVVLFLASRDYIWAGVDRPPGPVDSVPSFRVRP